MGLIGLIAEIVVLGFCAAAVVTNSMLLAACDFMNLDGALGNSVGSIGLFKYQDPDSSNGECISIPDNYGDGWFRTAQTCSIIALCSGAILFFFGFCKQCVCPLPCTQCIMDLSAVLVQVCLALVYLVWGSGVCNEFRCTYGDGGNLLILTQIFWLAAGCFTRCMRPGRHERRDEIAANKEAKKEKKARQEAEAELEKQREQEDKIAAANDAEEEEAGGGTGMSQNV